MAVEADQGVPTRQHDMPVGGIAGLCKALPCGRRMAMLRLDQRFALAGSFVSLIGMIVISAWVGGVIEESVTRNSAISTTLYMESFIAPLSQELATQDSLSPESRTRFRKLLQTPPISERIVSVKIWKKGGLVAFSTDPDMVGRRFEPNASLVEAWKGHIMASFDEVDDLESQNERALGVPLLEVYNPIHSIVTGKIIAVAEFYHNAQELKDDLFAARLTSWLIVGATTLITFGLLFGIVRNGSNIIARQHRQLEHRLTELARISDQNDALRRRIQAASLRAGALNERYLRRISAELHDGPAQSLALAALRLDSLSRTKDNSARDDEITVIRHSLDEAMQDIRLISRGLTLPELEGKTLSDVLRIAIDRHERRTGTMVGLNVALEAEQRIDHSTLICIYRFVQEGLMNAFRHAEGKGQRVSCRIVGTDIEVEVVDDGPGFDPGHDGTNGNGLGLNGLRERIESTGGEFRIESIPNRGTRLIMRLPIGS